MMGAKKHTGGGMAKPPKYTAAMKGSKKAAKTGALAGSKKPSYTGALK